MSQYEGGYDEQGGKTTDEYRNPVVSHGNPAHQSGVGYGANGGTEYGTTGGDQPGLGGTDGFGTTGVETGEYGTTSGTGGGYITSGGMGTGFATTTGGIGTGIGYGTHDGGEHHAEREEHEHQKKGNMDKIKENLPHHGGGHDHWCTSMQHLS
ncbi:hypothetical protein Lalb_Chr24g0397741 [Lupinus albus]|uniref:Dehydrin n=1 Tax=Lupinus albus TaxID=3870 RepID=A0A6A4N3I1_LUPAL|nr:hypothetical protein Lalb_Chr24g0397741 [Lupinus albus]